MINSKDFPNIQAGAGDSSGALNEFLLAAKGETAVLEPGIYYLNSTLVLQSGTRFVAPGVEFRPGESMPVNRALMTNANLFPEPGVPWDQDIVLDGPTFNGLQQLRADGLTAFLHCKAVTVRNCTFTNAQGSGLVLAYYDGALVEHIRCSWLGRDDEEDEQSAGLWLMAGFPGGARNATVNDPRFEDLLCGALAIGGDSAGGKFVDGTIINDMRSSRTVTCAVFHNDGAARTQFNGGFIEDVKRRKYSGSGMEMGGREISVRGMNFRRTANGNIDLTSASDVQIVDNFLADGGTDKVYPGYAKPALIQYLSTTGAAPGFGIVIGRNTMRQRDREKIAPIRFAMQADAPRVASVNIAVQCLDGDWPGGIVRAMPEVLGVQWESVYPVFPY